MIGLLYLNVGKIGKMRDTIKLKEKIVRLSYHKKLYYEENHWFFCFLDKLPPIERKILVNILYKTLNDADKKKWLEIFNKEENDKVNENKDDV